jgi:hypothetical protein
MMAGKVVKHLILGAIIMTLKEEVMADRTFRKTMLGGVVLVPHSLGKTAQTRDLAEDVAVEVDGEVEVDEVAAEDQIVVVAGAVVASEIMTQKTGNEVIEQSGEVVEAVAEEVPEETETTSLEKINETVAAKNQKEKENSTSLRN